MVEVEHPLAPGREGPGPVDVELGTPARTAYRSDGVSDSARMPQNVPVLRVLRRGQGSSAQFVYEHWCEHGRGPEPAGRPRGHRPRPAPDRAGLQGAPARDHLRGRPGLGELQPAQVPAVLQLPEPGRGVDRRRASTPTPAARSSRWRSRRCRPSPGKELTLQELLRLLPRRPSSSPRVDGVVTAARRRRSCTSAPRRGTGTTTTSSTSATR